MGEPGSVRRPPYSKKKSGTFGTKEALLFAATSLTGGAATGETPAAPTMESTSIESAAGGNLEINTNLAMRSTLDRVPEPFGDTDTTSTEDVNEGMSPEIAKQQQRAGELTDLITETFGERFMPMIMMNDDGSTYVTFSSDSAGASMSVYPQNDGYVVVPEGNALLVNDIAGGGSNDGYYFEKDEDLPDVLDALDVFAESEEKLSQLAETEANDENDTANLDTGILQSQEVTVAQSDAASKELTEILGEASRFPLDKLKSVGENNG